LAIKLWKLARKSNIGTCGWGFEVTATDDHLGSAIKLDLKRRYGLDLKRRNPIGQQRLCVLRMQTGTYKLIT
jgi:hypothetical protein